jgi:hypothetical protein
MQQFSIVAMGLSQLRRADTLPDAFFRKATLIPGAGG